METELKEQLLGVAAAYAAATGHSRATTAQRALLDWRFFERLEAGATFTVRKYDRAIGWFSAHWPAGAEWPLNVPRPAAQPAEPEVAA